MTISRKSLCLVYAISSAVALVGTWGNNIDYLKAGFVEANVTFWQETLVNPASRSITVDLLFLAFAAIIWMVLEARRLSMRGVWLWVLAGLFIAIAAAFPLFLIQRERTLAKREGTNSAGTLTMADAMGIALVSIPILAYVVFALR